MFDIIAKAKNKAAIIQQKHQEIILREKQIRELTEKVFVIVKNKLADILFKELNVDRFSCSIGEDQEISISMDNKPYGFVAVLNYEKEFISKKEGGWIRMSLSHYPAKYFSVKKRNILEHEINVRAMMSCIDDSEIEDDINMHISNFCDKLADHFSTKY